MSSEYLLLLLVFLSPTLGNDTFSRGLLCFQVFDVYSTCRKAKTWFVESTENRAWYLVSLKRSKDMLYVQIHMRRVMVSSACWEQCGWSSYSGG